MYLRVYVDQEQDDAEYEQEKRDCDDARSKDDEGEEQDDDPGNLGTVSWRGYPEDHEIDPEDQEERGDERVGQNPQQRDPTRRAEWDDLCAGRVQREIRVTGPIALHDHPTAARARSELRRTRCDEFRRAPAPGLWRVGVEVGYDDGG